MKYMKEQLEFKIKKNLRHILVFVLVAVGFIFFILLVTLEDFICLIPLYGGYILGITALVALLISLFYFPMSINLTYMIKIKYLFGREKGIAFFDIEGYDINTFWPAPSLIDIKLKNRRKISFFIEKEHFEYIENYFKNHNIEKL